MDLASSLKVRKWQHQRKWLRTTHFVIKGGFCGEHRDLSRPLKRSADRSGLLSELADCGGALLDSIYLPSSLQNDYLLVTIPTKRAEIKFSLII